MTLWFDILVKRKAKIYVREHMGLRETKSLVNMKVNCCGLLGKQ